MCFLFVCLVKKIPNVSKKWYGMEQKEHVHLATPIRVIVMNIIGPVMGGK